MTPQERRAKLQKAIAAWDGGRADVHLAAQLDEARQHLATLPEPKDHVIVCRDRSTGKVELFSYEGENLFTAEEAAVRAKNWAAQYHGTSYTAVKVAP